MLPLLRAAFWASVAVTLLAMSAGLLLSYDGAQALTVTGVVAAWVAVVLGPFVNHLTQRERRRRYERAYPTREALLQAVDGAAIRAERDAKGRVHAVRTLRKQVPEVPLAEAVAVVDAL